MLQSIIYSSDPKLIVIKDSGEYFNLLWNNIIEKHLDNDSCVVIFSYLNIRFVTQHNKLNNLRYIDTKLSIWEGEVKSNENLSAKCILLIDSLDLFILENGFSNALVHLKRLLTDEAVIQIVGFLHFEKEAFRLESLKYLSNVFVEIEDGGQASYTYRKENAKLINKKEQIKAKNGRIYFEELKTKRESEKENKRIEEMELSTFKISLKADEKISRDQLVLPYIQSGGQIEYYPDENDDLDDEDPDDDLNI